MRDLNNNSRHSRGLVMVFIGATLWGLSGTAAQFLFEETTITLLWLVTVRMLFSGIILLAIGWVKGEKVTSILRNKQGFFQILIFGLFGMLGVQYTYFASIATGNAATATLLQYLAPVFIVLFLIVRMKNVPSVKTTVSILFALLGTLLLVTNGHVSKLSVPVESVGWGILSGLALAFYTLYSSKLIERWDSTIVVGWGMVIGSIFISFYSPPWNIGVVSWSLLTVSLLLFIIFFGTLLAFYLYIESLRFIKPDEASVLSSVEPLSATIAAIVFLHVPFGIYQMVGGICIIVTVILLSTKKRELDKVVQEESG